MSQLLLDLLFLFWKVFSSTSDIVSVSVPDGNMNILHPGWCVPHWVGWHMHYMLRPDFSPGLHVCVCMCVLHSGEMHICEFIHSSRWVTHFVVTHPPSPLLVFLCIIVSWFCPLFAPSTFFCLCDLFWDLALFISLVAVTSPLNHSVLPLLCLASSSSFFSSVSSMSLLLAYR